MGVLESIHHESRNCHRRLSRSRLRAQLLLCAEAPSLDPTRSSLLDTAVTVCPLPSWELRLAASTSTTTFACSPSRAQSAWDPTSQQSAFPTAWRSTTRAPAALCPAGEPQLRVEALPMFSRRAMSPLCLT